MITESQQRTIRRECDVIIALCKAALEHCLTLNARCVPEDNQSTEHISDCIRAAMMGAGILREINDKRKAVECQLDK